MSTLPDIEKTWQQVNNVSFTGTSGSGVEKSLLLSLKNTMKGFALSPWTVRYSCNGTLAGTAGDLVDRWLTTANLVRGTTTATARSWIVLRQNGIASGFDLLIDFRGANDFNADIYISWVGFSGGTTTARPTAADEVEITTSASFTGGGFDTFRLHVHMTSDGQCTRVFMMSNSLICGFWIVDRLKKPHPVLTHPVVLGIFGTGNTVSQYLNISDFVNASVLIVRQNNLMGTAYMSTEGCAGQSLGELLSVADDLNNGWTLSPVGIVSNTSNMRGRYGQLFDFWCGSTGIESGTGFDETNSKAFCTVRDFVVISNGQLLAIE